MTIAEIYRTRAKEEQNEGRAYLLRELADLWGLHDGTATDEDGGDFFEWLDRALDIEYVTNAHLDEFKGARVQLCCGGPSVWLDTRRGVLEYFNWAEYERLELDNDLIEWLNDNIECWFYC